MSTPTMPEPFATIHDAITTELAAEGITCYDHLPIELYGVPSAYLNATDVIAAEMRADQGELLVGSVTYSLKYFVSLEQDARIAWNQAYSGVRSVYRAFAGATLGGMVRDARIERVSIDPVEMGTNGRPMLLVESTIVIRPGQYS